MVSLEKLFSHKVDRELATLYIFWQRTIRQRQVKIPLHYKLFEYTGKAKRQIQAVGWLGERLVATSITLCGSATSASKALACS